MCLQRPQWEGPKSGFYRQVVFVHNYIRSLNQQVRQIQFTGGHINHKYDCMFFSNSFDIN